MVRDFVGSMAKQTEHDFEALLAWNLFQVGAALRRDLVMALRKSRVKNVKIQFVEKLAISSVNGWCCRGDRFSVRAMEGQLRLVDMDDGIERIENERVIMHGFYCLEYPNRRPAGLITVENLTKRYAAKTAIENVSFQ